MKWKDANLRQRAARVLSAAAVVVGLLSLYPWFYYYDNLPRSPQPDVGRIYAMNMHGVVAYATRQERRRLNISEDVFFGCVGAGFLAAFLISDELRNCRSG